MFYLVYYIVALTGCSSNSNSKKENPLPSAKTILTNAQKTKFQSMHATWSENSKNEVVQKAEAQYVKDPTVNFLPMFQLILTIIKCGLKEKIITFK